MGAQNQEQLILFVDFGYLISPGCNDNKQFVEQLTANPQDWVQRLESGQAIEKMVQDQSSQSQRKVVKKYLYTSSNLHIPYQERFVEAGFQLIDCRPANGHRMNSTISQIIMDILDSLDHKTYFDEFIILSGGINFLPVLQRLRVNKRRAVIYSDQSTIAAYQVASDGLVLGNTLLDSDEFSHFQPAANQPELLYDVAGSEHNIELANQITAAVAEILQSSSQALMLSDIATRIRQIFGGQVIEQTKWAGYRSFRSLLQSLMPDNIIITSKPPAYIYDITKHVPPADNDDDDKLVLDEHGEMMMRVMRLVHGATGTPILSPQMYYALFETLEDELRENGYSLTGTSAAIRGRLRKKSFVLSRKDIAFVLKGLVLSGHFFTQEDRAADLAEKFYENVLFLCDNAGFDTTKEQQEHIRCWINSFQGFEATGAEKQG